MTINSPQVPESGGFSDASLEEFLQGTAFDTRNLPPDTPVETNDQFVEDLDDGGESPTTPVPSTIIQGSESDAGSTQGGTDSTLTTQSSDEDEVWEWDDGFQLPRSQARALAEFDAFLAANPELAAQIAGVVQGQYQLVPYGSGEPNAEPVPTTPALSTPTQQQGPPPDLDLDDPQVKLLWDTIQQQQAALAAQQQRLQSHEVQLSTQTQATTQSLISKAEQSFKTDRSLTDEQMVKIREVAGRLNVLPSLLSPVDPITQLPRNVDPLKAVEQAFDIAYWQLPEFRNRQVQATVDQTIKDNTRKAKASSVGGNSGSVRRTPVTKPKTKEETRQEMIREVAGYFASEQGDN